MNRYPWVEEIDFQKFAMPFVINSDNEYFPSVKNILSDLVSELKRCGASDTIVTAIQEYKEKVISSIELYYQGNLVAAQLIINEILDEFGNTAPAITDISNSFAFPGGGPDYPEIQFFRARLSDSVVEFSANEMLHIPFNKRHIVKSERFSIPGLPCLYLGNSSYACWVEMGCPADHRFNVAPLLLDNTQRVLNLTVSMSNLYEFNESDISLSDTDAQEYIINLLKLFVLTLCTSYKVEDSNRNFKSEYILSQMIMLACKNRDLDGITYYSKQILSEILACNVGVNLVLFAKFNGESYLSDICQHIKVGTSFNFSMFKQLLPCQLHSTYDLRVLSSPYINNVGTKNHFFPYKETQFYEFDKYLFANWHRDRQYFNV